MNHHRHKSITQEEFSRQAEQIASAPSFTDEDTLTHLIQAVGSTYQDEILDVACGTGIVAFRLAKTAKEVVGLDLTGEMLQKARKQRHEKGITNVHFELGEVEALPFDDDRFDATVCRISFHHFDDPQKALAQMCRVTKPGGKIVIVDIVASPTEEAARLHNAIERLRDPSHVRMLGQEELVQLVADSGLKVERTDTWRKTRYFEEWEKVLNAPARIEPLKVVLEALAKAGCQAGIQLRLDEAGKITFEHTWMLILATKPK